MSFLDIYGDTQAEDIKIGKPIGPNKAVEFCRIFAN